MLMKIGTYTQGKNLFCYNNAHKYQDKYCMADKNMFAAIKTINIGTSIMLGQSMFCLHTAYSYWNNCMPGGNIHFVNIMLMYIGTSRNLERHLPF